MSNIVNIAEEQQKGPDVPVTTVPHLMNEQVLRYMKTFYDGLKEIYNQQERTNALLEEIRDGLSSRTD